GDIQDIVKLKLTKIQQRFQENHRAELTYEETLVETIGARCNEVDSGARNIDYILTQTLLPGLAEALLERMALGETFSSVHVSTNRSGGFTYTVR
ncbi:MAG: type VI secretion system ATPase TssH, partial [Proteobacteria bacterium]|nr:type VI secretion system ATPase TssH [Pseudomonadota bacterium]